MPSIDFSKIAEMLESSTDFSLSEKQFAESRGLKIHVQEKTITFEKSK